MNITDKKEYSQIPWIKEISKYMGMHEQHHNSILRKWLASDRKTLGDPAKLPWCGDAVETAIKNTLPKEVFTGALAKNPYWARNWAEFGVNSEARYGAIGVFVRGSGGHVGFLVGISTDKKMFRIRGGNQQNTVSDGWIAISKCIAVRKPKTWIRSLPSLPILSISGKILNTNEAMA